MTDKTSGKHKGIAFIEFDKFDKMETCLKKYHHSVFPDAKNKAGRKINIELRYRLPHPFPLMSLPFP